MVTAIANYDDEYFVHTLLNFNEKRAYYDETMKEERRARRAGRQPVKIPFQVAYSPATWMHIYYREKHDGLGPFPFAKLPDRIVLPNESSAPILRLSGDRQPTGSNFLEHLQKNNLQVNQQTFDAWLRPFLPSWEGFQSFLRHESRVVDAASLDIYLQRHFVTSPLQSPPSSTPAQHGQDEGITRGNDMVGEGQGKNETGDGKEVGSAKTEPPATNEGRSATHGARRKSSRTDI